MTIDLTKPRVATVIVLGFAPGPKLQGREAVLFGQTRGFYKPDGSLITGSPGERSIFSEHFKEGVDQDLRDTALRCCTQEFWPATSLKIFRGHLIPLVDGVETEKSINTVFLFRHLVEWDDLAIGQGDGLLRIPYIQLPWYIRDGHLTEASIKTLQAVERLVGSFEKLWKVAKD